MKTKGMLRVLVTAGLCAAVTGVVLGTSSPAMAQTEEERAGARAAATEGAEAFKEERWQDAVDLFQRAESLVHAPPHLLYMARANEKLGNLVKARELYNKITRENLSADAPEAFRQAQAEAAKELKAVEPRLARLTVKLEAPEGVTGEVMMDGVTVPAALVGIPHPVDPGDHELTASAPGYKAEAVQVSLDEGGSDTVSIQLVVDPNAPVAAPPGEAPTTPAEVPMTPTPTPEQDHHGSSGMRIGSYAALGVGVVGVGLGTAFAIRSGKLRSDADTAEDEFRADCGNRCLNTDPRAQDIDDLDNDAASAKTMATVGFVVGGVGLATGVTLFLLSQKKQETADRGQPRVRGWIGLGSAGLSGRF